MTQKEKALAVECLLGEEPGAGVQGRAGSVRGLGTDPGPGQERRLWRRVRPRLQLPPPALHASCLTRPLPFSFPFFPPPSPNVRVPALRQAGHWTLERGDEQDAEVPCLLMLVFSWGRDDKQINK